MANQRVNYQTSTNPEVNDGLDSGHTNNAAIRPVIDGQAGNAATFTRPSENLRTRTEVIRTELEALKYYTDADRGLLLTSTGDIAWAGLPTGTFSSTAPLTLKPFMAPTTSTAPRLKICAGTVGQITIRGKQLGTVPTPRAYSGANNIRFTFVPVISGTGAISIAQSPTDPNYYTITYDSHLTSGTTVNQLPGNSFLTQFNANGLMIAAGLEAVVEGGGTPAEAGFPTPPASVAATLLSDPTNGIQLSEQATRFMSGAADAERHVIQAATLTSFWAADGGTLNKLVEGDVLCIWYDALVNAGNGRRESTTDLPESSSDIPVGSLFLLRRFPERLPGAIPVATVVNGQLIFISGRVYGSGESGPLVSSGSSYQGSSPNQWADGNTIAAGTFESAIDNIVAVLGTSTAPTGAQKIGIQAIAGSPISTSPGGVYSALSTVVTGANAHINNGTGAHAATAISATATVSGTSFNTSATQVQGAIADLALGLGTHKDATAGAHAATAIANTPAGNIAATTVQAAVNELDTEKAGLALANTFTKTNTFTASVTNTDAVVATGNGNGAGVNATASASGPAYKANPTGTFKSFDAGSGYLYNVKNPSSNQDAATKYYVDYSLHGRLPQNYLYNSGLTFWQRYQDLLGVPVTDISITNTRQYWADRWYAFIKTGTPNANYYRSNWGTSTVPVYGLGMWRNTGTTNSSEHYFVQEIEYDDSNGTPANQSLSSELIRANRDLGFPITLQFIFAKGTDVTGTLTAKIVGGRGTNNNFQTGYTNQLEYATTGDLFTDPSVPFGGVVRLTIPAYTISASNTSRIAVVFEWKPTATASLGSGTDWIEITNIQLHMGNPFYSPNNFDNVIPAPNFVTHSFGTEFAALQRYYEKSYALGDSPGMNSSYGRFLSTAQPVPTPTGTSYHGCHPRYRVEKRRNPDVTLYHENGTMGQWVIGSGDQPVAPHYSYTTGFEVANNGVPSVTPASPYEMRGHWTSDAEI